MLLGLASACACAACGGDDGAPATDADPNAPDADPNAPDARDRPDAAGGIGEPAELDGITLAHNVVRAAIDTDVPLPQLAWNDALEATAAAWAAQCIDMDGVAGLVDHNPNRSQGHPYYVGENIYGSSGNATAEGAVELWVSEGEDYDYATNSCSGLTCGHYTQVVWRATRELGCAKHDCPGLTYGSTIVCDYGPGGNDGNRPY
jgi:pathogenesis-related protein 1